MSEIWKQTRSKLSVLQWMSVCYELWDLILPSNEKAFAAVVVHCGGSRGVGVSCVSMSSYCPLQHVTETSCIFEAWFLVCFFICFVSLKNMWWHNEKKKKIIQGGALEFNSIVGTEGRCFADF